MGVVPTGASFTGLTVSAKSAEYVFTLGAVASPESVAVTVIVTVPLASATGVSVMSAVEPVCVMDGAPTTLASSATAVSVTVCADSSAPPPALIPVTVTTTSPLSSSVETSAIASNDGASLRDPTVTVTVAGSLTLTPSPTTNWNVSTPVNSAAGV